MSKTTKGNYVKRSIGRDELNSVKSIFIDNSLANIFEIHGLKSVRNLLNLTSTKTSQNVLLANNGESKLVGDNTSCHVFAKFLTTIVHVEVMMNSQDPPILGPHAP